MIKKAAVNKPWLALVGLSLVSFLGCIDFTIVNTALPSIQAELHTSVTQLQWIITIFMLALSASMVIVGRIADIYGRRLILYIGMIIFGLSSLAAGLSPSIQWLVFFRLIQGIGVAILYTVPVAMIPNLFPESQRGKATGILIGVNGFGLAVGPVIGGFIVSALSWRWIFFVNPPIIILGFLFCVRTLIESKNVEHGNKIDWLGFILLVIALPTIVLATVQGSVWGWDSPLTIILYLIALVALVLFYFVESRSASPIIQFKLFFNRLFFSGLVANFSLAFFYTVAFFLMPLYLHNIQHEVGYQIGLTLLPATVMVAILSPVVGYFVDKSGPKIVLLIGFALFAISALMQTFFTGQTGVWFILLTFILFGIGWACILSPSIVAALSSVPRSISGVAMGSLGTLHNFGGAIGLAIGTVVFHYRAKIVLLSDVMKNNIKVGSWLNKAIADPDNAVSVIKQNTHLSSLKANEFFQHFFLQGYSSAMWLLLFISLMAFLIVLFGLKHKNAER